MSSHGKPPRRSRSRRGREATNLEATGSHRKAPRRTRNRCDSEATDQEATGTHRDEFEVDATGINSCNQARTSIQLAMLGEQVENPKPYNIRDPNSLVHHSYPVIDAWLRFNMIQILLEACQPNTMPTGNTVWGLCLCHFFAALNWAEVCCFTAAGLCCAGV